MLSQRPLGSWGVNRSYKDAIERLNKLQSGFAFLEEQRRMGRKSNTSGVVEVRRWLERIGYSLTDLRRLSVIHVAGTKGKGGTCAFIDSILREYRLKTSYPAKVGLYTSPHIKHVRERIQINSEPISEECFARYFFESWDKIAPGDKLDPLDRPGYFRFLTLMSFDIFLKENVTVAIYEAGVGGENDATNVIESPVATGITGLGIDHERTLRVPCQIRPTYFARERKDGQEEGATIEEIAWHKSGIFKPGCPAFSVLQQPPATNILRRRAEEKGVSLTFVESHSEFLDIKFPVGIQRNNAALAVALADSFLNRDAEIPCVGYSRISEEVLRGLRNASLSGRCQLLKQGPCEWYLDGAHTEDSLIVAGQWYAETVRRTSSSVPHILIFNQQSQRDGNVLLKSLFHALGDDTSIQYAIFCTNKLSEMIAERPDFVNHNNDPASVHSLQAQKDYSALWRTLDPNCHVEIAPTVENAVSLAREFGKQGMQTLVTGCFHLVGGVLFILEPEISN